MIILQQILHFPSFIVLIALFCLVYQAFIKLVVYPKSDPKFGNQYGDCKELPVTILVCAHQASEHLKRNLLSLLTQEYSTFEVLVVNDGEDFETRRFIQSLYDSFPQLRLLEHPKENLGKKAALSYGIIQSKYDWILLTDADCRPNSNRWIKKMMNSRLQGTLIVLGYSPYSRQQGILNSFIRFETVLNAIQYLSAANCRFPYMGVGRNLMYHKSIFNEAYWRPEHPSGDDDLLMNQTVNQFNTSICVDPDAFVYTEAKSSWLQYYKQRKRHFSSSKYYRLSSKAYLGSLSFSLFLFYLAILFLVWDSSFLQAGTLCLTWVFVSWISASLTYKKLKSGDLILCYPFYELIYLIFILLQLPLMIFQRTQQSWN